MIEEERLFSEDAVGYALYEQCVARGSKVFLKFGHNFQIDRSWYYWCAPGIDVIEVRADGHLVGYELKGTTRHKSGQADFPSIYDGIGQAVAYLDLPRICEGDRRLFEGGVFDEVYVVYARRTANLDEGENRTLGLVPIGGIFAIPDGSFEIVKEAPSNPIQCIAAKEHFLRNLDSLKRHDSSGRIFRSVKNQGDAYFNRAGF